MNFQLIYKFYYGSHFQEGEFRPSLLTLFAIRNNEDLITFENAVKPSSAKNKTIQPNNHIFRKDKNITIEYLKDGRFLKNTYRISDVWSENRFENSDDQLLAEHITHVFLG